MAVGTVMFRALVDRVRSAGHRRDDANEPEGPLFISSLYGTTRHIAGPIVDSLIDTDQRAAARLLDATLYAAPVLRGLTALIEDFDRSADLPGLDGDIASLLRQTSEAIYEGVKTCIYAPSPRTMDQSRFLMEVEFLLWDLTARPESFEEWRTGKAFHRNQRFGFGKLRSRRERDLGLETGHVLPDRDEYSVHSALVHPRPAREVVSTSDESPQDRRLDLLSDLVDLFQHAVRVADIAGPAIDQFSTSRREADDRMNASVGTGKSVMQAWEFIANWQASWSIPHPERPRSVPVKPDSNASSR